MQRLRIRRNTTGLLHFERPRFRACFGKARSDCDLQRSERAEPGTCNIWISLDYRITQGGLGDTITAPRLMTLERIAVFDALTAYCTCCGGVLVSRFSLYRVRLTRDHVRFLSLFWGSLSWGSLLEILI